MLVEIGHTAAMDVVEDQGVKRYVPVEGERVTTFNIPDGVSVSDAFLSVQDAIGHHIQAGEPPAWIKCDDPTLKALLVQNLHINPKTARPRNWGQEAPS